MMSKFIFDSPTTVELLQDDKGLRVRALAGKVGVNVYQNPDGTTRRELRHPDYLFDSASLKTLEMCPVTCPHPPEDQVPLTVANGGVARYGKGMTGSNVEVVDGKIYVDVRVTDAEALSQITAGRRAVSPGYSRTAVYEPGVWEGQPYDYIQTEIRYDHLAVVDKARGGHDVRLLLDGHVVEDSSMTEKYTSVILDGVEHRVDYGLGVAMTGALKTQKDKIASLTTELDIANAKVVAAESALAAAKSTVMDSSNETKIAEAVKAKFELLRKAQPIVGNAVVLDGLSDDEIRGAVVKAALPALVEKFQVADASAKKAFYEAALVQAASRETDAHKQVHDSINSPAPEKPAEPVITPRMKYINEQNANARKPINEVMGGK